MGVRMKFRGKIFKTGRALTMYHFVLWNKEIYMQGKEDYKTREGAKRASLRWAKKLGLEVEWVD
jgi:hypothetical protein